LQYKSFRPIFAITLVTACFELLLQNSTAQQAKNHASIVMFNTLGFNDDAGIGRLI